MNATKPGLFLDSGEFISSDEINSRWDGTSRPAALDEALPDTPDPAWGRNGRWYAVFLVLGCFVVALVAAQVVR